MYRETLEPHRGKMSDTAVIFLCLAVIFVFEPAMVLSGFGQAVKTVGQSVLVAMLVFFCIWFYRKRLRSLRYTFITDDADKFGELEELPESYRELEAGTLLAENTVGMGQGSYLAVVAPSEMKAFFGRGESFEIPRGAAVVNATLGKKADACALVYEQDGKAHVLYMSPGRELEDALRVLCSGENN